MTILLYACPRRTSPIYPLLFAQLKCTSCPGRPGPVISWSFAHGEDDATTEEQSTELRNSSPPQLEDAFVLESLHSVVNAVLVYCNSKSAQLSLRLLILGL